MKRWCRSGNISTKITYDRDRSGNWLFVFMRHFKPIKQIDYVVMSYVGCISKCTLHMLLFHCDMNQST
jgi:hypothetical protein